MARDPGKGRAMAVEEALRESERRYRLLAENAADVIWTLDNDWRLTYVSPSIVRLRGFTPEEALRQSVAETMTPESFARVLQSRREAMEAEARGEPVAHQRMVVEQYRKDGSTVWVESVVKPQYDEQGRAIGFVGVSRDVTERKRAEERVREMADFVRHNPAPVLRLAPDGIVLGLNPAAARVLGPGLAGTRIFDIFPEFEAVRHQELESTASLGLEIRLGERWFAFCAAKSSKDDSIFIYGNDISERKRTEEALGDARQFLKKVLDSLAAVVFVKDSKHRLIHVNKAACALTGKPREKITGCTDYDLFPKEQADFFWGRDHQVLKTGREDVSEDVVADSRGEARTLFAKRTRFTGKDGEKFVVGVVTDITGIKRAEAALRDSAAKFQALFERSPIGILIFNAQGVVLDANQAMKTTFGTPREKYLGLRLSEQMLGGQHRQAFARALQDGEAQAEGPYTGIFSGKQIYLKARINRIAQDLFMAFMEDVTSVKKMELSLIAAKESAEEAGRAKSEFLANMSHEIRTPLNAVLGLLQILSLGELAGQQKEYVAAALESGKSLLTLIGDILDLAKIEAGKVEIARRPFEPAQVLDTVAGAFREQAEAKGVSLLLGLETSLPCRVVGDEIRLRQVLFNLAGNAVKFTASGFVRISASVVSEPDIAGSLTLRFCIADTGVGIPADKIQKVFDPFTQADGGFTRKHQGTGLGLSIVKRLVELMGGTVTLQSEEGRGTTATVAIAFKAAPEDADPVPALARAQSGPQGAPGPGKGGLRILLVEDDALNLLAVKEILSSAGHTATCATNGELALAALRTRRFDLALMDIQMPVMDGLETTRRIRKGEAGAGSARMPIIAISAHAMKGDREMFLAAGMNGYIAKPVMIGNLETVIQECLGREGQLVGEPAA